MGPWKGQVSPPKTLCLKRSSPNNGIASRLYANVSFLAGLPPLATLHQVPPMQCLRYSWFLLFPGLLATSSAPAATAAPTGGGGSHQCSVGTTQQHPPSRPHCMPPTSHFRACPPVQGGRCHTGPGCCPHTCTRTVAKLTSQRDTGAHGLCLFPSCLQTDALRRDGC